MYCLRIIGGTLIAATAALLCSGCQLLQGPRAGSDGLKPGLNYMQPLKWRMTYKYRVQEIVPSRKLAKKRDSALYAGVPAVGKGTYEVWFVGPHAGEEIRDVKQVMASPEPTKVSPGKGKDSDLTWYYYDFAPDGYLPQELEATISWEFVTFERYTYWDGIEKAGYDKDSELYKRYTKEETPILFHPQLKRELDKMVKDIPETEIQQRAAICYNHLLQNFTYDYDQLQRVPIWGYQGMTPSPRAWENRHGVCDEIANVYCSMLRGIGIPARPCAGMVHDARGGRVQMGGGHAWTEFYMPNVGWVPVDATWGANSSPVEMEFSPMASRRKIPHPDYYFGKSDPFRITLVKDWNTVLQPAPKTPKADPMQSWFVAHVDRRSGVHSIVSGYEPVPGQSYGGKGWVRSESWSEKNFDMEVELLGPPSDAELKPLIAQIEAEGAHYLRVPLGISNDFPMTTTAMQLPEMPEQ